MDWKKWLLLLVLVDFLAITGYAMMQVGYLGIWQAGLSDWGSMQILADLVIAAGLICVWMVADARARGANPWPYVVVTLTGGMLGPLLYLLLRPSTAARGAAASAAASRA